MLTSMSEVDTAFAAAFSGNPLSPAILADDGRGAVPLLHEMRDQAVRIAGDLEQFEAAGAGLSRVQQLVGRLRDVAVVAVDRRLQPADRAALQRQVDLMLSEIDTVADETLVDESLLHAGASTGAQNGPDGPKLTPFRALSTGTLGIGGLAVRSSDQALAASGALEVATVRLERSAGTLGTATSRLQDTLDGLTNPTTTANGEPAIGGSTAALGLTLMLRAQLTGNPHEATQVQAGLDASRVKWLLDSTPR
jgi:flagellin